LQYVGHTIEPPIISHGRPPPAALEAAPARGVHAS
jgi:hypothetical protein